MKRLYAIYDRLAQEIVGRSMYAIMCMRTDQEATRYFADAIYDETSILAKHPADYELIYLGTMNDRGHLKAQEIPTIIITGDALVALNNKDTVGVETSTPR